MGPSSPGMEEVQVPPLPPPGEPMSPEWITQFRNNLHPMWWPRLPDAKPPGQEAVGAPGAAALGSVASSSSSPSESAGLSVPVAPSTLSAGTPLFWPRLRDAKGRDLIALSKLSAVGHAESSKSSFSTRGPPAVSPAASSSGIICSASPTVSSSPVPSSSTCGSPARPGRAPRRRALGFRICRLRCRRLRSESSSPSLVTPATPLSPTSSVAATQSPASDAVPAPSSTRRRRQLQPLTAAQLRVYRELIEGRRIVSGRKAEDSTLTTGYHTF